MQEKTKTFGQSQILCLLAGSIIFFGGYVAAYISTGSDKSLKQFPVVHAMTSQADESFAACTVPLTTGSEGFFILDEAPPASMIK